MLKELELDKEPVSHKTETKTEGNKNYSVKPSSNQLKKKGGLEVVEQ